MMSEAERSWEEPIEPSAFGVCKWEPDCKEGRGQVVVPMPEGWDDILIDALDNNLNSQGIDVNQQGDRMVRKYWTTNRHVSDRKLILAAKIIRRWQNEKAV